MASAFRRASDRYVAQFEHDEIAVVVMLLEQTRALLAVSDTRDAPVDEFEHLMRSAGWGSNGVQQGPAGPSTVAPPASSDPALARLLPDPNLTDPAAAAEFRRLTGAGLRERKAATISAAILALTGAVSSEGDQPPPTSRDRRRRRAAAAVTVSLDQAQAHSVMVALTDVRLVLGERLGLNVETNDAEDVVDQLEHSLDSTNPLVAMAFAYDFLTWLQESLVQALLG